MANGFDINQLLSDKNFLSTLAGIGAGLDPTGAGGAIGIPTQRFLQSKAAQESLIKLLSGQGLTPKEAPGPTSVKMTPDKMTLDITRPSAPALAGQGSQELVEQNTGSTGMSLRDFIQALLR